MRALAEETAGRAAGLPPTVWAHGAGRREIARGHPGDRGALQFHFPRGDKAYAELVGKPGLRAVLVVDRLAGHILGVRFRDRGVG